MKKHTQLRSIQQRGWIFFDMSIEELFLNFANFSLSEKSAKSLTGVKKKEQTLKI